MNTATHISRVISIDVAAALALSLDKGAQDRRHHILPALYMFESRRGGEASVGSRRQPNYLQVLPCAPHVRLLSVRRVRKNKKTLEDKQDTPRNFQSTQMAHTQRSVSLKFKFFMMSLD